MRLRAPSWTIGASCACWIALAILQGVSRGFDPIWRYWSPGWNRTLESNATLRWLMERPAVVGSALSLLITLLFVLFWRALWPVEHPSGRFQGWRWIAPAAALSVVLSYPFLGSDVLLYQQYARIERVEGRNPYALPVMSSPGDPHADAVSMWAEQATPYGPLVQRVVSALYLPNASSRANTVLLRLCWMALYSAFAWHALRWNGTDSRGALGWFLLCNPLVYLELFLQAHTEMLWLVLIYFALWAASRARTYLSALLLVVSLLVKPIALLLLLPVTFHQLWTRGRRAWLGLLLGVLTGAILVVLFYAPYWVGWQTLAPLWRESQTVAKSLAAILVLRWHRNPAWIELAGVSFTVAAILAASWRARTFDRLIEGLAAVLLAYLLLVTPFFQLWYLAWFIPLLAVHPKLLRDRRWILGGAVLTISGFWGSYGIQFILPDQGRPLELMSAVCVVPTLAYLVQVGVRRQASM